MVDSHYLGPVSGLVPLNTWDEVVSAAQAGVLDESQWVELKEQVPASNRKANTELARDLASLSLDGGVLLIGVQDDNRRAGVVVGVPPEGLKTRLSQVAHGAIKPPLPLTVREVTHPTDPELVVLVVVVPASLSAPHMVDERYWGRSAEGKRVLSDTEVRRVLQARAERASGFTDRLAGVADLDPHPAPNRQNSHLFLLAEPVVSGLSDRLSSMVDRGRLLSSYVAALERGGPDVSPSMGHISFVREHPDGFWMSYSVDDAPERDTLVLVVCDDCSIRLVSGRASDTPRTERLALTAHVITTVHQALRVAAGLGREHLGFDGQWQVGVRLDDLKGVRSIRSLQQFGAKTYPAYPNVDYERVITTSSDQLVETTAEVVSQLLGGYLRGLGHSEAYETLAQVNTI
ncbi:ATP-binding protein [Cellulomonas sp. ACRRI]|uniref:AlbA family DNA-binding domain-containing protein n=1 Tax=Cellulomonas sp. ACRRI TaxID=2918188 RepID=UPI001EF3A11F|nr:ATP-binding protein [Cellulomonas sp. ACRRI]MCG7284740.1 ATP-binding protein [Cellulomonas sp. ACRRI]